MRASGWTHSTYLAWSGKMIRCPSCGGPVAIPDSVIVASLPMNAEEIVANTMRESPIQVHRPDDLAVWIVARLLTAIREEQES